LRWGRLTPPGCSASWPTPPMPAPTCSAATTPAGWWSRTGRCAPSSSSWPARRGRWSSKTTTPLRLARQEWPVVIHDHHPAYISWDDYLADQARLAANTTNAGARPPREGHALCQAIIVCGSCGRPMSTRYHRNGHAAYECSASRAAQTATATCRSISAVSVDAAVAERLLEAPTPAAVPLARPPADEAAARRARRSRAAELAVERARYQ